jgi:hypothetical protein
MHRLAAAATSPRLAIISAFVSDLFFSRFNSNEGGRIAGIIYDLPWDPRRFEGSDARRWNRPRARANVSRRSR